MVEIRAGPQASRLRVLKYPLIHIRVALIEIRRRDACAPARILIL